MYTLSGKKVKKAPGILRGSLMYYFMFPMNMLSPNEKKR